MRSFLFILFFLFSSVGFSQIIEGTQAERVLANTNYFKNPLAERAESAADITDSSNILTVSNVTPLEGKKSFLIDATAAAQVVKIKASPIQEMDKNGFCEVHFYYSGDATLYKAYIEQGGVKLGFTERTLKNTYNSSTLAFDSYKETLNFKCGTSIAANDLVFESTGNGAAIKADKLYNGQDNSLWGALTSPYWQTYTPSVTASSGSLTNFTLSNTEFLHDGQNIYLKGNLTFTGAVGTWTAPRISLPSGITIASTNGPYLVNRVFLVDQGNNSFAAEAIVNSNSGTTFFEIGGLNGSGNSGTLINQSTPFGFTSGDFISWTIGPIKVNQTSSNQLGITLNCLADNSCRDVFSAEVSATGVISKSNGWLTSCSVTSVSKTTCTIKTNLVTDGMNCSIQGIQDGASWDYYPQLVTSSTTTLEWDYKNTNNGAMAGNLKSKVICHRSGADNATGRAVNLSFAGVPISTSSNNLRIEHSTVFLSGSGCSVVRSTGAITTSRPAAGQCQITYTIPFSDVTYCHCTLAYGHTNGNAPGVCLPSTPAVGPVTVQSIFGTSQSDPGANINVYCFGKY